MPQKSIPEWGWRLNGRTLNRDLDGSRHLLRSPKAICYDADAYDARRSQFDDLAVFDRETGFSYRLRAEDFDRRRGELDRGHGRQYFVVLDRWNINVPPLEMKAQTPASELDTAVSIRQLRLTMN